MSDLAKVVKWAKENGDVQAVARMRMYCISVLIAEKINLEQVDEKTQCKPETLKAVKEAAAKVVGKPCPL